MTLMTTMTTLGEQPSGKCEIFSNKSLLYSKKIVTLQRQIEYLITYTRGQGSSPYVASLACRFNPAVDHHVPSMHIQSTAYW